VFGVTLFYGTFFKIKFCFFGAKKPRIRVLLGKSLHREFPDPQLDFPNDLRDDFVGSVVQDPEFAWL
jgi:hypothetical protein